MARPKEVFVAYVKHVLIPELRDNDLVVMDNLGAHKDTQVRPLIEAAGAKIAYLPPYSPDLKPVELARSKVKWWLAGARARSSDGIDEALNTIMDLVTPADAQAWFKHCGYRYQPT